MFRIIFTTVFIVCVLGEKFRFDNYVLYRITTDTDNVKVLKEIRDTDTRFDFWNDFSPLVGFVNVMVSPAHKKALEDILNENDIKYSISLENVQDAIDKEKTSKYTRSNTRSMQWNAYYTMDDINAWLDDMVARYSNVASIVIGGQSYEGREIRGIKISHGPGRKAIVFEGGLHSREWITVTCSCYVINELLTNDDPETRAAAQDYDWYIFPVTNPDGYIWSHESFRMWRKNRRPVGAFIGVDLNRNWNNNWLEHGASTNPATDTYAGPGPFSEIETRSYSRFLMSIQDQIEMYLSVHSYTQLLLLPFGNTTEPLANYHDAINIGRRAMGALSVRYGTQYVTGNVAEAIYFATGGTIDWVKGHLNVPLVYCYELRDLGTYGFLLPEDQILPNNEEVMDSVLELIHQARRFGYM